ncbi:hypothetical protein ACIBF6_13015 [Streptosporangium amethystogenes]|uniref:hypothetical protein n=1 Tax=Streptosporangium amethystogenes TaxID=2002 RepID=UPI003791AD72
MTTPDGGAGSLVLPPRSPEVTVGALTRPAEDLRLGDHLAFERDRDHPFRITPVRGHEHGYRRVDFVWGQVTQLDRLGSWKPPTFPLSVSCSFASDASLITTLFNRSPVLLRPSRSRLVTP